MGNLLETKLTKQSLVGLISFGSTPITGIALFAIASTLIGEERLEATDVPGSGDLAFLGGILFFIPAIIGITLIILDLLKIRIPFSALTNNLHIAAVIIGGAGLAILVLGLASVINASAGDANIGGGILAIFGFLLLGSGFWLYKKNPWKNKTS